MQPDTAYDLVTPRAEHFQLWAERQYNQWRSHLSATWQPSINKHLEQLCVSEWETVFSRRWATEQQRTYSDARLSNPIFEPYYWDDSPGDSGYAYLDFYNACIEKPHLRVWCSLPLHQTSGLKQLSKRIQSERPEWCGYPILVFAQGYNCQQFGRSNRSNVQRNWWIAQSPETALSTTNLTEIKDTITIRPGQSTQLFQPYQQAYDCYQRTTSWPLIRCQYSDFKQAENHQGLFEAIDNETQQSMGVIVLGRTKPFGIDALEIKEKCLFLGHRRQGKGVLLEAALYRYLKAEGYPHPIIGGILSNNLASTACATAFNRQCLMSESLVYF